MSTINEFVPSLIQLGGVGLMLWWLTQKLIPNQMEAFERRIDKLQDVFRQEMCHERALHHDAIELLMKHSDEHFERIRDVMGKM
jgi:hypothetical protein